MTRWAGGVIAPDEPHIQVTMGENVVIELEETSP
jgi:hypothetical protein